MCKAWEEQRIDGIQKGIRKGIRKSLQSYIQDCLENNMDREAIIKKSIKIFNVSGEEAKKCFEECALQTV